VRLAHKTGNVTTVEHDGGIVYKKGRKACTLVVLTQWPAGVNNHRYDTVGKIGRVIWDAMVAGAPASH
jgi:beta-lactamase class A